MWNETLRKVKCDVEWILKNGSDKNCKEKLIILIFLKSMRVNTREKWMVLTSKYSPNNKFIMEALWYFLAVVQLCP